MEKDFLIRYRLPRPLSRAYEAACFSLNTAEITQCCRWCANVTVRFLAAIRQAGCLADGLRQAINPPSRHDLKHKGLEDPFPAELGPGELSGLLHLAGIYSGTGIRPDVSTLLAYLERVVFLARFRLVVVESGGFRILLGPRIEYQLLHPHPPVFLEENPVGSVVLVDLEGGGYLGMNPLLTWSHNPHRPFGHLYILRRVDGIMGQYVEDGLPGSPSRNLPIVGRPRRGRLPVPHDLLQAFVSPAIRFHDDERLAEDYRIRGLIWRGASSDIFIAERLADHQDVVLKTFESDQGRFDRNYWHFVNEERFGRQVEHASAIKPYRVSIPTYGTFYEQELASRGSLHDFIAFHGVLRPDTARDITLTLLDILEAIHASGIVHNDIKPDNILFDSQGAVRLIDFGIAASLKPSPRDLRPGSPPGSWGYMAPELAAGGLPGIPSDLFATGVVLCQMLSGQLPNSPEELALIREIPQAFHPFLAGCLEPDPQQRFASARQARGVLEGVTTSPLCVISLDIEGTLIDNFSERNARPGLYGFLSFCLEHFSRIFVYTLVDREGTREVFSDLVRRGLAPAAFLERYEYIAWDRQNEGDFKDLRRCLVPLEYNLIVYDSREVIPEDQLHRWIRIAGYHERRDFDRGLKVAQEAIMRRLGAGDLRHKRSP